MSFDKWWSAKKNYNCEPDQKFLNIVMLYLPDLS